MRGISVLISVYIKDSPIFLKQSLESICQQNLMPNQIVLVQDGPLNPEISLILAEFETRYPNLFDFVVLKENRGLGNALRIGAEFCKYDFIARMDADDICRRERFEKQFNFLATNPNIDVLGSNIEEFNKVPGDLNRFRNCPETHDQLVKEISFRSPFNHPSIMIRKKALFDAGGYDGRFLLFEDYALFLRLWKSGAKFHNIQDVLLDFRVGDGLAMIKKRSGIHYFKKENKFLNYGYNLGAFNKKQFVRNKVVRLTARLLPPKLVLFMYNLLLRK
ncbi:glycosyltransferase [Sphingobacterium sp. HSC-15S19]|uniref:glycosyltransferase n=1 Tax=Sphingobacterium sp. HSC-15S19 TaxID=2910971 RepID=UPI003D1E1A41